MGNNEEKKALVIANNALPIPITSMAEFFQLAKKFEESGMFGCTKQGQGAVLLMACLTENKSPIRIKQTYHIIQNELVMKPAAMLASFVLRGGKYTILERSKTRAAAIFEKDGNKFTSEITIQDAVERQWTTSKTTGKEKDNWKYIPEDMLWSRMISRGVRVTDPVVNFGIYTPEEATDYVTSSEEIVLSEDSEVIELTRAQPIQGDNPFPKEAHQRGMEPEEIDYTVIPFGVLKGKKWGDLTIEQLKVCETIERSEMTKGHQKLVTTTLNFKKAKKKEAA